jgi:hypothetical protein
MRFSARTVAGEQLQKTLREQHSAVLNVWSGHQGPAQDRLHAYLEWATSAVQHLGNQIIRADLDRLVLTPGYERLLSVAGRLTSFEVGTQRVLNGMLSLELQQRVAAFEAAYKVLDEQIHRWSRLGAFLVADTTVFIEHENKLEELDLAAIADAEDDLAPVHLFVPIVVVDELTGLKDKADKPYKRWRAGYTLAVFDRHLYQGEGPGCAPRRSAGRGRIPDATARRGYGRDRLRPARPRPIADQR